MPQVCENTGSAARDYAMLERNLLSHIRLATLLLLLSSSLLLNARLPFTGTEAPNRPSAGRTSLASLQLAAALTAIGAGVWEYRRGYKDMQDMKGFLMATKCAFRSFCRPVMSHRFQAALLHYGGRGGCRVCDHDCHHRRQTPVRAIRPLRRSLRYVLLHVTAVRSHTFSCGKGLI